VLLYSVAHRIGLAELEINVMILSNMLFLRITNFLAYLEKRVVLILLHVVESSIDILLQ